MEMIVIAIEYIGCYMFGY